MMLHLAILWSGFVKIAFLTLAYPEDSDERNIYSDLVEELQSRGNSVIVINQDESRSFGRPTVKARKGVKIYSIPTGKITKVSFFIKAINLLLLEKRLAHATKMFELHELDALIYSTPPITFFRTVLELKKRTKCKTYLLLKDIFPQNAVDLGLIKKNGIAHNFFRQKEKALYAISDFIGCMSPANIEYFLYHNRDIPKERVHLCPNAIKPMEDTLSKVSGIIPGVRAAKEKFHLVYGGNLGKPQGIPFVLEALQSIDAMEGVFTTIVGSGTESEVLRHGIETRKLKNVRLLDALPKNMYLELLAGADVGLVFLDKRFTIPNFPSRILDYMDIGLPIVACTDSASDIKTEICDAGAGIWCPSGDSAAFALAIDFIMKNKASRMNMGMIARNILINKYSATVVAREMENRLKSLVAGAVTN